MKRTGIVVGVDGSTGSAHALEWAAREARLRGTTLTIVSAWYPPAIMYAGSAWAGMQPDFVADLAEVAKQALDKICDTHSEQLAGLVVERRVVEDAPANALLEAARDAELLVVGTRGHGGFAGLLLGSVSHQCAHHARCPVVIVPPAG